MNRHQVLSGACNSGDRCFAVGSVEGIPFTAYAAGCNIVILASNFERVQIIPGAVHNYVRISCLDSSTDTGKIAAAYEKEVCIFEPTPLIPTSSSSHVLDYRWVQTGTLTTDSSVTSLSWNLEGTRLLTGGETLQMWHQNIIPIHEDEYPQGGNNGGSSNVTFEIGEECHPHMGRSGTNNQSLPNLPLEDESPAWECVWRCKTASPVTHMAFSPDSTLFATAGNNDRLVKIWFENKHLLFPTKSVDQSAVSQISIHSLHSSDINFSFIYIAHPRAVTHLSWRETSKYMPKSVRPQVALTIVSLYRGSVSNMLVTSCKDNICRIWVETILPDDGLVNMYQFDPLAAQNPKFRTHRHKHRFMQRLKHMKTCFHLRRHAKHNQSGGSLPSDRPVPTLLSTYSVHDFHNYGLQGTGMTPGLHFHLAASVNAETDIPLVPSLVTGDPDREPNFILHWLNNNEMHFSQQAESILQELHKKMAEKEEAEAQVQAHVDGDHDEHPLKRKQTNYKINKSISQDESGSDEHPQGSFPSSGAHSHQSLSAATSTNSLVAEASPAIGHIPDSLDTKIDSLLRDWHHSPDLLYSIHPIDGSFLIWVVEWLDEYHSGSFRQAQVSFSTRIPNAFPLGDAMTMSTHVCLYNTNHSLHYRNVLKPVASKNSGNGFDNHEPLLTSLPSVLEEETSDVNECETHLKQMDATKAPGSVLSSSESGTGNSSEMLGPTPPVVSMVSKHSNGTLNLWQLQFADKSKFSQVLSIGHASRASGHRFRVNDITCHPVLPLLLTTSHHNLPDCPKSDREIKELTMQTGFCSELILWRVDAVGPLLKSGGVSELARINSPEISAFSNVAWIPTLLPSTTLGNLSNSPSACFVASDGECLRVYQAVIDARTLLAEVSSSERRSRMMDSTDSLSTAVSSDNGLKHLSLHNKIKIVSQQSTSRPGCIIQLDAIADATHDWQNTQFLHVFQEQLITGERCEVTTEGNRICQELGLMETQMGAMVDLQQSSVFEEPFYIVVLERTGKGTTVHMWRLVIASQPATPEMSGSMMYVPDSHIVQDEDELEVNARSSTLESNKLDPDMVHAPHVLITTTKVCTQDLAIPEGVEVIHASPAAGHLSSASIYPACFAPYIIVTACSDSTVRFWKCKVLKRENSMKQAFSYEWCEWEMIRKDQESTIEISGQPLNISAAYSGRIACAYKYGKSFTRPSKSDPDSRFVNLCVAIYECESTGGSEWILEDTIHLKNIHLPRIKVDPNLDLSVLQEQNYTKKHKFGFKKSISQDELLSPKNGEIGHELHKPVPSLLAVPSFSTLQSLRKSITDHGNVCPLTQKHLVQLDWVSKEDGSHILTVGVGSKILLFTPVSSDLAQANMKAMKESQTTNRPILRKASSLAAPNFVDEIRWMKLRRIDLSTADGLPPLPMQISWVRDGILVVGMDSEMHVYSQWKSSCGYHGLTLGPRKRNSVAADLRHHSELIHQESEETQDTRNLRDEDLKSLALESSQRRLANVSSMPHLSRVSSINLTMLTGSETGKKKKGNLPDPATLDYMPDYGLFEASRIACPVLPQYHPKQLMELLNSGKIRWVKAILSHLVRCISGTCMARNSSRGDDESIRQRGWSRSRTLSVSYAGASSPLEQRGSTTAIPEELTLDYAEITSIPPLPLWTLLAADKETTSNTAQNSEDHQDYNDLFDGKLSLENESLDDYLEEETENPRRTERRHSGNIERQGLSHFGPRQGRLLSRLLTHTHLPGLSSLDQMHLLALADTVSTCNTDFAERFANDAAKTAIAKENLTGVPHGNEISTDSLDDCGLRFLLAMKHYNYLIRCLPLAQRAQFQKQGVSTNNLVWAFHSESEEELLHLIPSYAKGSPKWSVLKELGVGWWLRSNTLLKTCIEKVAKASYLVKEDPLDAAIFYLAMKKKSLVWGLFRSKRDQRMTDFLSNNFKEDRWRKAALKNAFALLGKQRFEHAAAFFLLAGALKDAIEVCLNKLEDFQLAMVIIRLYDGELDSTPEQLKRLLYKEILGCDGDGKNCDSSKAHPDPFLRSMALWMLKDHAGSLNTLLQTNIGNMHPQYNDDKPESTSANPNVFNFYVYLRTHPLLIRQFIASTAMDKKKAQVVLSGFSYNTESKRSNNPDKQLMLEDSITPLERQLYFTTAHAHFKAGCPALALEVLSKLPNKVIESNGKDSPSVMNSPSKKRVQDHQIDTGILNWGEPVTEKKVNSTVSMDFSTPLSTHQPQSSAAFDWSQPVYTTEVDEGFKIQWDDEEENENENEDDEDKQIEMKVDQKLQAKEVEQPEIKGIRLNATGSPTGRQQELNLVFILDGVLDIMAQQLKFVACLKIVMEELSTLATGFEVDGGQLRYQLYVWLEREVDALRQLCNYSSGDGDYYAVEDSMVDGQDNRDYTGTPTMMRPGEKPTLHEILMAEKLDFEAKVERAAKRKRWLKANETLLRTLLSYCSLHGASGGGLASVRMELVLLLQELQQEKTQQQLLSPLPFPTTLPLLSASVACNKTVIADPIRHLQAQAHDMLQTMVELRSPPVPSKALFTEVFVLRDLAIALSACIYQSLCDSDSFSVKQQYDDYQSPGMDTLARLNVMYPSSHLIGCGQRKRRYSLDEPLEVTTHPNKWPGVTNLRALLAREKDEDTPRLNILLCESFIATYMSLTVYAMSTCDCHILYRIAGHKFSNMTWSTLYGGGVKKLLRAATTNSSQAPQNRLEKEQSTEGTGVWNAMTSLTKQRVRLNMKLLGQFSSQSGAPMMKEDKPTYREQFVPPEMSMISYFLIKPNLPKIDAAEVDDYDSADSAVSDLDEDEEEEDVFDNNEALKREKRRTQENTEHSNPFSYSWSIMRLAVLKLVQLQMQEFLGIAGLEMQELPVCSPLIHGVLRGLAHWQETLKDELDTRGPAPVDYIPGCYVESTATGPAIHKYRSLLEKSNTPFHPRHSSAAPARRLWCFLVRQEPVQDIFIRCVFGKKRSLSTLLDSTSYDTMKTNGGEEKRGENSGLSLPEPVRIIHKDQDSISAFCLNQVTPGFLSLATPREIQEMDISLLLELPSWLEDECEFDIINLNKEPETLPASSYLVIQTAADKPLLSQTAPPTVIGMHSVPASPQPVGMAGQTGRGASVVLKHKVDGIRRMSAHPLLPLYLTGSQDGSVQMWEWGHTQPVATPRSAGTFAKVTRVRFSQHGNKFGVADGDGKLSLFQVGLSSNENRSFFSYQCHNKVTTDFVFLGSCSMVATAGHSSESKNVAIWDSLLPKKKAMVAAFVCHEQGASSLVLAPQHQYVISAGKKGDVCIFDVRQRTLRLKFQAHESAIKCLAVDPMEEFFVTGSADGDIKVWSLANTTSSHTLYSFPGEHARSSFFKNIGQGVTQLYVDSGSRLFSCGADGSMKVRQLPDRDTIVQSLYLGSQYHGTKPAVVLFGTAKDSPIMRTPCPKKRIKEN
ncbi:hypothetical protein RUM43_000223 [Polyplax serrata]|uniref:RAVE complex protein Rav1 C-terminal domain-containing protein n=1 Tax=Polyplax serrata TaxID=468196 RepID=A0AAN8XMS8_POLSC